MHTLKHTIELFELSAINWMHRNGLIFLRISLGIIFFWFGILKYYPRVSPAEDIAINTINRLTFNLISPKIILLTLATWEVLIGVGFISGKYLKLTLLLLFSQMLGTTAPIFLFPNEVFSIIPYAPTLEGQYIIKNIVLISAGFVIGGNSLKKRKMVKST